MRILLKCPISPHTGYGNEGIGLISALMKAEHDVYLKPLVVEPPIPRHIAMSLTRALDLRMDLGICLAPPIELAFSIGMHEQCAQTVAWTMWEYDSLDNFTELSAERVEYNLEQFDDVFVYDPVSRQAIQPHYQQEVFVLQGGYDQKAWPQQERDWSGTFKFCMVGYLSDRKNPFTAIEAFKELREEHPDMDAELHLKTSAYGLHPSIEEWVPGVKIHAAIWPHRAMLDFYRNMHVLLAPSSGEGKNLPAIEFLSTGGTVIATDWGGHLAWLSDMYAYRLGFELETVPNFKARCAKPHKDHLKHLMWRTYSNRFEAREKGELAARTIPAMCSWDTTVDKIFKRLRDSGYEHDYHRTEVPKRTETLASEATGGRL